jgi:hypothetical protein
LYFRDAKRGVDRFGKDCNSAMALLRSKTQELLKFVEELTDQHANLAVTGQHVCAPDVIVREEDAHDLVVSLQQLKTSTSLALATQLQAVIEQRSSLLPQLQAVSDMLQVGFLGLILAICCHLLSFVVIMRVLCCRSTPAP